MSELLYTLALLACPVGMGAMMLIMNRKPNASSDETAAKQAELAELCAEVDRLRGARADTAGDTRSALERVGPAGPGPDRGTGVDVPVLPSADAQRELRESQLFYAFRW